MIRRQTWRPSSYHQNTEKQEQRKSLTDAWDHDQETQPEQSPKSAILADLPSGLKDFNFNPWQKNCNCNSNVTIK